MRCPQCGWLGRNAQLTHCEKCGYLLAKPAVPVSVPATPPEPPTKPFAPTPDGSPPLFHICTACQYQPLRAPVSASQPCINCGAAAGSRAFYAWQIPARARPQPETAPPTPEPIAPEPLAPEPVATPEPSFVAPVASEPIAVVPPAPPPGFRLVGASGPQAFTGPSVLLHRANLAPNNPSLDATAHAQLESCSATKCLNLKPTECEFSPKIK
ncbi:MAG: hypothetical protein MUC97_02285 [Bernardetiaceae bacterium]|nr:hypothetical protein [Bernardetiaceae bacterium]